MLNVYKCKVGHKPKVKKTFLTIDIATLIDLLIRKDYSPEQISGYFKKAGIDCISPETIYSHLERLMQNRRSL